MRGATRARCTDLPRDHRRDLHDLIDAALRATHPARLVAQALRHHDVVDMLARARHVSVVAAGKAAAPMFTAWWAECAPCTTRALVTAALSPSTPAWVTYVPSSHPFPDERSVAAGAAALQMASTLAGDQWLLLLISGGASSMLALPRDGVTLDDKIATSRLMMQAGADILSLNRVRTHLSAIKGGGLARASRGRVITLAISDVCGVAEDAPSVIGSGPGVADGSTRADARAALARVGVLDRVPERVRRLLEARDEPVGSDEAHAAQHAIIGSRRDAMEGAASLARERGYQVVVIPEAITGDARLAAVAWVDRVRAECRCAEPGARVCVVSSGETTMTVTGDGVGGRNQEFALAAARVLAGDGGRIIIASVGTDGIDGNSPAAGAIVDPTTIGRAERAGISIADALARNDTFHLFERIADAVITGPTQTNVGDLQIALFG